MLNFAALHLNDPLTKSFPSGLLRPQPNLLVMKYKYTYISTTSRWLLAYKTLNLTQQVHCKMYFKLNFSPVTNPIAKTKAITGERMHDTLFSPCRDTLSTISVNTDSLDTS